MFVYIVVHWAISTTFQNQSNQILRLTIRSVYKLSWSTKTQSCVHEVSFKKKLFQSVYVLVCALSLMVNSYKFWSLPQQKNKHAFSKENSKYNWHLLTLEKNFQLWGRKLAKTCEMYTCSFLTLPKIKKDIRLKMFSNTQFRSKSTKFTKNSQTVSLFLAFIENFITFPILFVSV